MLKKTQALDIAIKLQRDIRRKSTLTPEEREEILRRLKNNPNHNTSLNDLETNPYPIFPNK